MNTTQHCFCWRGRDAQGALHRGESLAANREALRRQLCRQGLREVRVQRKRKALLQRSTRLRAAEIALFTRQLATMLRAGLPLVQAFDLTAQTLQPGPLRERISQLRDGVAAGLPFANALRQHPRDFEPLYCNLVAAGESSGTLDVLLERLAQHLERSEALKARVAKALRYPLIVLAVAFGVTALLLVKVVPAFAATFGDLDAELPKLTQAVLAMSEWTQLWWPWLLGLPTGTALVLRLGRERSVACRHWCERRLLHIPALGSVVKRAALARLCRTLATTFAAGLPLVDALAASAGATGNVVYQDAVMQVRSDLATGQRLSRALQQSALFPPLLVQLVAVGEESGTLDSLLARCAGIYEEEADRLTDKLTAMLEPLIMAVLGGVVGVLLLALYLPMFQLGSVL